MCAPTTSAFFTRLSRSSLIVASDAAHDTGLPPNVLACVPGGHDMISDRAVATPSGSPDAIPFAIVTTSG